MGLSLSKRVAPVKAPWTVQINHRIARTFAKIRNPNLRIQTLKSVDPATIAGRQWQHEAIIQGSQMVGTSHSLQVGNLYLGASEH